MLQQSSTDAHINITFVRWSQESSIKLFNSISYSLCRCSSRFKDKDSVKCVLCFVDGTLRGRPTNTEYTGRIPSLVERSHLSAVKIKTFIMTVHIFILCCTRPDSPLSLLDHLHSFTRSEQQLLSRPSRWQVVEIFLGVWLFGVVPLHSPGPRSPSTSPALLPRVPPIPSSISVLSKRH